MKILALIFLLACGARAAQNAHTIAQLNQRPRAVVLNGLVAWWKLDDATGTTAADSSGNGNTLTLSNSPAWSSGPFGGALTFAASSSQAAGATLSGFPATAYTLAAWVKKTTSGEAFFFGMGNTPAGRMDAQLWVDGNAYLTVETSGSSGFYAPALNDTNWHHIVMAFDGTLSGNTNRLRCYIDNVLVTTPGGAVPGTVNPSPAIFTLAWVPYRSHANGAVDSVRIYNRQITAAEVALLYTNP